MCAKPLIILDRDGVLNSMLMRDGVSDSPMIPEEVRIPAGVPEALATLTRQGYLLAIATNQPAAAKGKISKESLEAVHARILAEVQSQGGQISASRICWHRAEDACECRKPKPGMLKDAILALGPIDLSRSWMIGDRVVDMQAGRAASLHIALLAEREYALSKSLDDAGVSPDFWGTTLPDFIRFLI